MQLRHNYSPINKNDKIHARVSCGAHSHLSGCAHFYTFVMSLSSPYTGWVILISICHVALIIQRSGYAHFHLSCHSHLHTLVGLRLFPFVMSLSFPYSGRATLILHCRVALIFIQQSGYSHFYTFVMSLSFSYSGTCCSHFH